MNNRRQQKKLLIGIILLFIATVGLTSSVKGQEDSTSVTPLSTVSVYQLPKALETSENSPNSPSITPSNKMGDNTSGNDIPVPFPEPDVMFEKVCDPIDVILDEEMTCIVTIQNNGEEALSYKLLDFISNRMVIQEDSVVGGDLFGQNMIAQRGVLAGGTLPSFSVENGDTPLVYNSLKELGIPPLFNVNDEAMINVSTLEPYVYAGETYTTVGISSNGYLIPGLGSDEDIAYIPQIFPDPQIPNNVVAPFWTDLNPEAGGAIYAALLTRDGESWAVIEWENVPAFDSEKPTPNCVENCDNLYTFQVWLKTNTVEQDVTFIYAHVGGSGAASGLNIGVEDKAGMQGANYDLLPTVADKLVVTTTPGTDGETHVISYTAQADRSGHWYGCALLKVYSVRGVSFDCVYGNIVGDPDLDFSLPPE